MKQKSRIIPLTRSNRKFFQGFYDQYKNFLMYIADRFADTLEDREDLVQESLTRLMRNTDVLQQLDRPQTAKYIELTVKTTYLDMEKSRCKENLLLLDQAALSALLDLKSFGHANPEADEAVGKLKKGLSSREWLALEGKYILGYSHEELGQLLDISEESMRSLLYRARKRAIRILKEQEDDSL